MPKPVFLLAFANAHIDGVAALRNLPLELGGIREALRAAATAPGAPPGAPGDAPWETVERTDATLDDVVRVLADYRGRLAIFHYGGHAGGDELALESPTGAHAPAYAEGLAALLGQQALPLVFLNGCSTQGQVKHLLDAGVQAVIATSRSIDDARATRFATDFYAALGGGASLRRAFEQAAAAARAAAGDLPRAAYRDIGAEDDGAAGQVTDAQWPWALHVSDGAAARADWSLAEAIGDPLFGLPRLPDGDLPPDPFRGLQPFTAREARIFFGRGAEIRALYDQIHNPAGAPILLLYGQSGAGKSSLLDAGLMPRLAAAAAPGAPPPCCYGPVDAGLGLAGTLRRLLGIGAHDAATTPAAAWRARVGAGTPAERPFTVVLDQVEQAYTRASADDGAAHRARDDFAAFVAALGDLFGDPHARPPGRLVLAFRKEWLAEVEARLRQAGLPYEKVFLERLDARGVAQAVTGVATDAGLCAHYHLEIDVPDALGREIADDLVTDPDSPIAPTLQVLLTKLWAEAGKGATPTARIDAALYRRVKAQGLALGAFVNEQLDALAKEDAFAGAIASGLVLDLLASHTTALVTAQARPWADLVRDYGHYERLGALVDRCEALSLLAEVPGGDAPVVPRVSMQTTTELRTASAARPTMALAHDTLAPLVRRLFAESDRPGQRARRILESRLCGATSDANEVLDGIDLRTVEAGVPGMRALTQGETALVTTSARARTVRRLARRLGWGAAAAGLAVLVVTGAKLWSQSIEAASERDRLAINAAAAVARSDPLEGTLVLATLDGADEQPGFLQTGLSVAAHPIPAAVLASGREVNAAAVSPDGRWLATAERGGVVRLLARDGADTGRVIGRHAHDAIDVAFSPDGRRLASAGDGGWVIAWRLATHDSVAMRQTTARGDSAPARAVVWDPSGHEVMTAGADGVIRFWVPTRGVRAPRDTLDYDRLLRSAAFDPPGQNVVQTTPDGFVRVRRMTHGAPLFDGAAGTSDVAAALSADRRVVGAHGPYVLAWKVGAPAGDSSPDTLGTHAGRVNAIALAPDGLMAASVADDSTARLWRVDGPARDTTGRTILVLPHPAHVRSVHFTGDGRWIVTTARDRRVRFWSTEREGIVPVLRGPPGEVTRVAYDSAGAHVLAASASGVVSVWTLDGSAPPVNLRHPCLRRPCEVLAAAFAPNGSRVVTAAGDSVRVWNVADPRAWRALGATPADLRDLVYSRDGERIVAVRGNGTLVVWPADGIGARVDGPAAAQAAGALPAGSASPDGALVATADDSLLRVWDARGARPPRVLGGHTGDVLSAAFARDGRHLVSAGGDATAIVWDLATGDTVVLRGHTDVVWRAVFSPDGRRVATASQDGSVRIWQADGTGTPLATPAQDDAPTAVAFAPDGAHIAVAGESGLVRLWPVTWKALMDGVRAAVPGCLGAHERETMLAEHADDARSAYARCVEARRRTVRQKSAEP